MKNAQDIITEAYAIGADQAQINKGVIYFMKGGRDIKEAPTTFWAEGRSKYDGEGNTIDAAQFGQLKRSFQKGMSCDTEMHGDQMEIRFNKM